MSLIRKMGKARWVHECRACGVSATRPDQFRAIEVMQAHNRSLSHLATVLVKAFEPLTEQVNYVASVMADLGRALTPPPNTPHDPTLMKDRRRWGGRS